MQVVSEPGAVATGSSSCFEVSGCFRALASKVTLDPVATAPGSQTFLRRPNWLNEAATII